MVRYDSDGTSGSESGDEGPPNSTPNPQNNHPPGSWRGWKERGKQAYLRGDYGLALQNYSQALQRQNNIANLVLNGNGTGGSTNNILPSGLDKQILLSNMVACRLKLGGAPQAEAAVANAQKCISIDPNWAKGHMRLAEAHLALSKSTNHDEKWSQSSNRACEALQRVIGLDPTNQTARNMLTKELRYNALHNNTRSESDGQTPEPSAPPEHMDETNYTANSNVNSSNFESSTSSNAEEHQQQQQQQEEDNDTDEIDIEDDNNYVFAPSWQDRLAFGVQRVRSWYTGLSEDDKSLVKLSVMFVVLYVAFGGRFGLEYLGKSSTPPRRSNSVYDDFYQSRSGDRQRYDTNNGHDGNSYGRNSYHSSSSNYRHRDYSSTSSGWGGNSWGMAASNVSHGQYMLLVLVLSYVGQRFFGIGPYQVLFFVNMLAGRRNRWFAPRRGYGWGQGMYFNPRADHYRHRPRGMWG